METVKNINTYDELSKEELEDRVETLKTWKNSMSVGYHFQDAWEIFKKNPGGFILYGVVLALASNVFIIYPPIAMGAAIVTDKYLEGEEVEFGDFFKGFDKFGELLGVGILVALLTFVGIIACVIPGIFLAIVWSFAPMMVYFCGAGIWDGMEASRKLLTARFWEFFVFCLLCGLICLAGVLVCGVGILVALPVVQIATFLYFRSTFIKPNGEEEEGLEDLNLEGEIA